MLQDPPSLGTGCEPLLPIPLAAVQHWPAAAVMHRTCRISHTESRATYARKAYVVNAGSIAPTRPAMVSAPMSGMRARFTWSCTANSGGRVQDSLSCWASRNN